MIGPTTIETPLDIQPKPQRGAPAKQGAEDTGDRRAFDDLVDGTDRSAVASDQTPAGRNGRVNRPGTGEKDSVPAGEQASGTKRSSRRRSAVKLGTDSAEDGAKGADKAQALTLGATLAGASTVGDGLVPGSTVGAPASAAGRSGKIAPLPRSGWFSGQKADGPGAVPSSAAVASDEAGDRLGMASAKLSVEQAAKSHARQDNLASPTDRAPADKGQPSDGGAVATKPTGPARPPDAAMVALLDAGSLARRQTANRNEVSETSLMARIAGDGHHVGDTGRITARDAAQPVHQVAMHIVRAAKAGQPVFQINLHPKELGQVDVTLEFRDGRLHVTVAADRPDTLQQLQQNARILERALHDAGLNIGQSGVHFASRDGQSQSAERQTEASGRFSVTGPAGADDGGLGVPVVSRYVEGVLDISL